MEQRCGVNLGGWLVLERWIAPSVFEGAQAKDEWSLAHEVGQDEFRARLKRHRETFITEKEINQIAQRGLEFVRVPIGYWLFEDQDGFISCSHYLDQLFEWVEKYDLKVILDFHAPNGSQNGWDHSGRAGELMWQTQPEKATGEALRFIKELSEKYGQQDNLIGIEVLNEPHWDVSIDVLIDYYLKAAEIIRRQSHTHVAVIMSDAFRPEEMSKRLRKAKLEDVVLDVHLYQLYTPEDRNLSLDGHVYKVEHEWSKLLRKLRRHHDVLVGEWSAAMSELYLQLHEEQKHYDPSDYERYFEAQRSTFEKCDVSWSYWTAKTEDRGIWSLLDQQSLNLK